MWWVEHNHAYYNYLHYRNFKLTGSSSSSFLEASTTLTYYNTWDALVLTCIRCSVTRVICLLGVSERWASPMWSLPVRIRFLPRQIFSVSADVKGLPAVDLLGHVINRNALQSLTLAARLRPDVTWGNAPTTVPLRICYVLCHVRGWRVTSSTNGSTKAYWCFK